MRTGRCTVSFDLRDELARATREYAASQLGQAGAEAAARAFKARIGRLEMVGASARDALERQMTHTDAMVRNAAARVLSGMHDVDAAARLCAAVRRHDRPQLDAKCLARLSKDAALPAELLPTMDEVRPFERAAAARALFRRPSPQAVQLIDPIFAGFESV